MSTAYELEADMLPTNAAVARLSALAQPSRLAVFRLLVAAGREGMRASDIAGELGIAPNTLSTHLRILTDSGLLSLRALSRERFYAIRFDAMRDLIGFLLEDCCKRSPDVCVPLAGALAKTNCCS